MVKEKKRKDVHTLTCVYVHTYTHARACTHINTVFAGSVTSHLAYTERMSLDRNVIFSLFVLPSVLWDISK